MITGWPIHGAAGAVTMKSLTGEALAIASAYAKRDDLACFLDPKHPYADDELVHRYCLARASSLEKSPTPDLDAVFAKVRTMVAWVRNGLPVFQLTQGLVSSLVHTDCGSVDPSDIRPAFGSFCVNIPDRFWHAAGSPIRYLLFGVSRGINTRADVAAEDRWVLDLTFGYRAPLSKLHRISLSLSRQRLDAIGFCSNGSLLCDSRIIGDFTPLDGESNLGDHENRLTILFQRLWINLNLYIAERGRGKLLSRPLAAQAPRRGHATAVRPKSPMVWLIGQEVPLDRNLYEAARACETVAGYRIAARFTVRGHWRNQACGAARAERKLTWIKPYWKGPAEGERIAHLYTSGGENDSFRRQTK